MCTVIGRQLRNREAWAYSLASWGSFESLVTLDATAVLVWEPRTRVTSANLRKDSTSFWNQTTEDLRIGICHTRNLQWQDGCYLWGYTAWTVFHSMKETKTLQSNNFAVSKLIWPELDGDLSNAHVGMRSSDDQCSTRVRSNVPVRTNQSLRMMTRWHCKWTDVSKFQSTRSACLNLLDLCFTPAWSLKTSSRTCFGRLLIKSTDISAKL